MWTLYPSRVVCWMWMCRMYIDCIWSVVAHMSKDETLQICKKLYVCMWIICACTKMVLRFLGLITFRTILQCTPTTVFYLSTNTKQSCQFLEPFCRTYNLNSATLMYIRNLLTLNGTFYNTEAVSLERLWLLQKCP